MSFDYLLFDWDGCLADTISIWMAGYKKIFAEFNLSPTEREIVTKVFGDWQGPTKVGVKDNDFIY